MDKENIVYTDNGSYSAITKDEILLFMTICMNLENIMLDDISQIQKDKHHMTQLICGILKSGFHRWTEQNGGYQRLGG